MSDYEEATVDILLDELTLNLPAQPPARAPTATPRAATPGQRRTSSAHRPAPAPWPSVKPDADAPTVRRLSKTALAKRLLAWHNTHPLARRWRTAHVSGAGLVAIPFSAPLTHDRGADRAAPAQTFALLDDLRLGPGLPANAVLAFARRHGWPQTCARTLFTGWPVKHLPVAPGWDAQAACHVLLPVVQIHVRGQHRPLRFLVGQAAGARNLPLAQWPVMGPRQWSTPKLWLAGLAATLAMTALLVAAWPWVAKAWSDSRRTTTMTAVADVEPPVTPVAPTFSMPATPVQPAPTRPPPAPMPRTQASPTTPAPATGSAYVQPLDRVNATTTLGSQRSYGSKLGAGMSVSLVSAAGSDPPEVMALLANTRSAVNGLGQMGRGLQVEVIGTSDGDAVAVFPFSSSSQAEQVGQALVLQGITLRIAEPEQP